MVGVWGLGKLLVIFWVVVIGDRKLFWLGDGDDEEVIVKNGEFWFFFCGFFNEFFKGDWKGFWVCCCRVDCWLRKLFILLIWFRFVLVIDKKFILMNVCNYYFSYLYVDNNIE